MQATWNAETGFKLLFWSYASYAVTSALLALIFFAFGSLQGWPLGLSLLINLVLLSASTVGKRDHQVTISLKSDGLMFRDEAPGYNRQELIRFEDISTIRVRGNPFFRSLIIDLKEDNQRFALSNATLPTDFLAQAQARVNYEKAPLPA